MNSPAPNAHAWPATGLARSLAAAMAVITLGYLSLELAFNYALVFQLGTVDPTRDQITTVSLAGVAEMGRRLTATAVALIFLGSFMSSYVKHEAPWPAEPIRRFLLKKPRHSHNWGIVSFGAAAGMLVVVWLATHWLENSLFEWQAHSAAPSELQNMHVAINASKAALAAAYQSDKDPGGVIRPASIDLSDVCLLKPAPNRSTVLLDKPYLDQTGARPFAAALPYLLAERWRVAGVAITSQRCEAARRWRLMFPTADTTYDEIYPGLIREAERWYNRAGPFVTPEPDLRPGALRIAAPPITVASLVSQNPALSRLAQLCMPNQTAVDFKGAVCIRARANQMLVDQARTAGADYAQAYADRRAAGIAENLRMIDQQEAEAANLADNLDKLTKDQRSSLLTEINREVDANACLHGYGSPWAAHLNDLGSITTCAGIETKVKSLAEATVKDRAPGSAFLDFDRYSPRHIYLAKAKDCFDKEAADRPSITQQCNAGIAREVADRASRGREQAYGFPAEPRAGMVSKLTMDAMSSFRVSPETFPPTVNQVARTAINRAILATADERLAPLLLTEDDRLPACATAVDWANDRASWKLTDSTVEATGRQVLQALDWCALYDQAISQSGAAAFEFPAGLPPIRVEIRTKLQANLAATGMITSSQAANLAYRWISDDWQPQTVVAFSTALQRDLKADLLDPILRTQAYAMGLEPARLEMLLDHPPANFQAFLREPEVATFLAGRLQTVVGAAGAYAGLKPDVLRPLRLTTPFSVDWRQAWRAELYNPLMQDLDGSVLRSRVIGQTRDYVVHARCYEAGVIAYKATLLPSLGLLLSVAGLIYHSRKAVLYLLRALPLPLTWQMRHFAAAAVAIGMIVAPLAAPPSFTRTPLASSLLSSVRAWPYRVFMPWMVAAQESLQGASHRAYQTYAQVLGPWDFSRLAPKADRAPTAEAAFNAADPRITDLEGLMPDLAKAFRNNPEFAKAREAMGGQFLCEAET